MAVRTVGSYRVRVLTSVSLPCHVTGMLSKSVVHAPNLKQMTLTLRNGHKSNLIGRCVGVLVAVRELWPCNAAPRREVVVRHMLALRMMNPSAEVDFVRLKEKGTARVDYELCTCVVDAVLRDCVCVHTAEARFAGDGSKFGFDIKTQFDPDTVVAKVMMGARDPALDE